MAGHGQGLRRRSPADRRLHRRLPVAGAAAQPGQGRAGATWRRPSRRTRAMLDAVRRDQRPARRADRAGRDGKAARRAGHACRTRSRRTNAWELDRADRNRHGRDEPAAGRRRRRRRSPAASGGAWPSARCCSSSPTCCCSTSRRTTSTPRASPGWSGTWPSIPARSSPSRTTATSSTTWPSGFWSSTAAAAFPGKGTTRRGWSRSRHRLDREEKAATARQKTLERELEWIRMSPAGPAGQEQGPHHRLRKDVGRAVRGAARRSSKSRFRPASTWATWSSRPRTSRKGYGDHLLIENLSFRLPAGGIVGVIGPNGAGKTTLFRMIIGQEKPDSGELRIGADGRAGLRRSEPRRARRPTRRSTRKSPAATTRSRWAAARSTARAYVARFNFRGTDQQKKVGDLSGGERNRVHLAKLLRRGCNVLLLDEPTNDLDVDTLRALEEAILNFAGCVVVISHDRWFLDRIATHILAFEGDGYVHWCEGNFQTYEEAAQAAAGHRRRPAAPVQVQEAHAGVANCRRAAGVSRLITRRCSLCSPVGDRYAGSIRGLTPPARLEPPLASAVYTAAAAN